MNRLLNLTKNVCPSMLTNLRGLRVSIFKNHQKFINSASESAKPAALYKNEFECILQFRFIKHLRLASRLKLYQTGFSLLFAIGSVYAYEMDYTQNVNVLLSTNFCMIFALIMLIIISRQTIKVVGKLYLSKDANKVLISHLSFLGKRRDIIVNTSDIEGLSSISELKDTFLKLKMNNMNGFMYMILPYSEILNKDALLRVLKAKTI
ncbi:transmembrane protein -like [Brachionus plicatilis]|uniref:Transmembrane protein 186 n=1 Tax=Brachionus plicatilis TaxID=10195 RepID=A0A3M7RCX6_BRAPC|nr:transmembrane protein -like [Brachionus plicatilis]